MLLEDHLNAIWAVLWGVCYAFSLVVHLGLDLGFRYNPYSQDMTPQWVQ